MGVSKGRLGLGVVLAAALAAAGAERRVERTDCYGDPLPEGAVGRLGTLRFRHPARVSDLAFTADGKRLVSACADGTAHLRNVATGKEMPGSQPGRASALTPDGEKVLCVEKEQTLRVWDLAAGKEVNRLHGQLRSILALSPDGKTLAAREGGDKPGTSLALWDLVSGKQLRRLGAAPRVVQAVAFSTDGKMLASGDSKVDGPQENDPEPEVRLWNPATGRQIRAMKGHTGGITALAFSPDGRLLASSSHDSTVLFWEPATGLQVRILRVRDDSPEADSVFAGTKGVSRGGVLTIAFSPNGKLLATGSADGTVRFWEVESGEELHILRGHGGEVTKVVFSRDGKVLASGSWDHTVRLWDPATGKQLQARPGQDGAVWRLAVSRDGRLVAALGEDRRIHLWSAATHRQLHLLARHKADISSAAFTPDGQWLASADLEGNIRLWDTATGKELPSIDATGGSVDSVAFPSGRLLLWTGGSALVFWDIDAAQQVEIIYKEGALRRVQTSFDGKIAVASDDQGLHVWDVATKKKRRQIAGVFAAHVLSPDGRLLATWSPQETAIRLWNVADGEQTGILANQVNLKEGPGIYPFVLSRDGRLLARVGKDNVIQLWETASGKVRRRLRGHLADVASLAFSPDGLLLYSGSHDTTVLVWDLARRNEPQPIRLDERQLVGLWRDLAGEDGEWADRAICTLALRPEESVPFLARRLKPARPADAQLLGRLIADLDGDDFAVRQKATQDLEQLRELAKPALRQAMKQSPTLEARRRMERLLRLPRGPLPAGDRLRELRAVEVLEQVGTPDARRLLRQLAKGAAGVWLTEEAKAALERLGSR